jgi:hypothetical protein
MALWSETPFRMAGGVCGWRALGLRSRVALPEALTPRAGGKFGTLWSIPNRPKQKFRPIVREHLDAALCTQALQRALQQRRPALGLIHHSDRGVQHAAHEYRQALARVGFTRSMSRKGNCYDNAFIDQRPRQKALALTSPPLINHPTQYESVFESTLSRQAHSRYSIEERAMGGGDEDDDEEIEDDFSRSSLAAQPSGPSP